jgi:Spy/CpxP family protein refolding chaperone
MLALLSADTIDRAALENARVAQLNVLDQASKELVQLFADTAGVLTPAQRKALADKLAAHLGASQG